MYICYLQETHFRLKGTHILKVKGWKNIFHENGNVKRASVATFIPDKVDFRTKAITMHKGLSNFTTIYFFKSLI